LALAEQALISVIKQTPVSDIGRCCVAYDVVPQKLHKGWFGEGHKGLFGEGHKGLFGEGDKLSDTTQFNVNCYFV